MDSGKSAFSSSTSRLITEVHDGMMTMTDPVISDAVLNDHFLSVLASKLISCNTAEEKHLCVMSLNILSWILSHVSCSDEVGQSNAQKKFISENEYLQLSFDRVVALISNEQKHTDIVNLCLFVIMEQCTPNFFEGRMDAVIAALVSCMDRSLTRSKLCSEVPKNNIPQNNILNNNVPRNDDVLQNKLQNTDDWKQPIMACSALCTILKQQKEEVLSRSHIWSASVFNLLIKSFNPKTPDIGRKNITSSENLADTEKKNHFNFNFNSDFIYSADDDCRLLPLSVSTLRILGQLPLESLTPLAPIAMKSHTVAMAYFRWEFSFFFSD